MNMHLLKSELRHKLLFSHLFLVIFTSIIFFLVFYLLDSRFIIFTFSGLLIFGLICAVLFSKWLSKPQQILAKAADKITKGHLDHTIDKTPDGEINSIADALNKLAIDLEQMTKEKEAVDLKLLQTRDEMEDRVKERTQDLIKEVEDRILVEKKYRKVMEASPVPISVFDMDGKSIYINPAFTQIFGWTLEEFQNERTNYIPDDQQELNLKIRRKIIKGEGGHGIETKRYNRQGDLLDVNISFDVWRGKDHSPIGCVVILHDVTQSKKLEKQLFQAQKMEAMGTLAGGIAHDFNNILSGIFAYSQLAEKHAGEAEKAKGHIQQIVKGAHRAAGLVKQILTFCRQTEYKKQYFNLEPVLKEALNLLHSTVPSIIEITEEIDPNINIEADPTQIHQVIMNLCTNACHAMIETGGNLSVRLNKIRISNERNTESLTIRPGNYVLLEIDDTGHGMDKETLEKAFDPYFTTKENGKGTGFGLALVKAIVESHDGYIEVSSAPEKGAHFKVYLPSREQQAEKEDTPQEEPAIIGGTEKIMVVDDEESIRMAIKEFLEDYGYAVSTFQDGKQALETFKKDPDHFDLILTDMTMPHMAGDILSKEILSIRKNMPVILSTGYSEKISEGKALEAGVKFFIQKPVSNQKMDETIRKALNKEKRLTTISSPKK